MVLLLPYEGGWAEDFQGAIICELGPGRGPTIFHDLLVVLDHFLHLTEMSFGQVFGFAGVCLQVVELNKGGGF